MTSLDDDRDLILDNLETTSTTKVGNSGGVMWDLFCNCWQLAVTRFPWNHTSLNPIVSWKV